jgi:hypothetical protein
MVHGWDPEADMMDLKIAILLLALSGTVFPAMACLNNATQVILGTPDVSGLIAAVIALTIMGIAGAYAIGSATNNPHLTILAKDEAYHLLFSIAILIGMSGIVMMACNTLDFFNTSIFTVLKDSGVLQSSCYGPLATMPDVATCYANTAENDAHSLSQVYINKYIDNLMDSTMSWSIQLPIMNSYTSTADSYKRIVSNQYDMIVNSFLIPALMSISMQKLGLQFIKDNVITWVLPTAFLLRVFAPTREMGNMMIALSLGLYIVIPFLYVFNFAMYDALLNKQDCVEFRAAVWDYVADGGNPTSATTSRGSGRSPGSCRRRSSCLT